MPTEVTVESLLLNLRQAEELSERKSAARTLGLFGPVAKSAVPTLQELLDDPDWKSLAENVLEKINGK